MEITSIKVSAGRTIPHPLKQFANIKIHLELQANLKPEDDANQCVMDLQSKADVLVSMEADSLVRRTKEDHEQQLRRDREEREERARQARIEEAEREAREAQERLEMVKAASLFRLSMSLRQSTPNDDEILF